MNRVIHDLREPGVESDNQMLVNQHIYGTYGYLAPILHLREVEGADLFDTYARSFELVWEISYPYEPES